LSKIFSELNNLNKQPPYYTCYLLYTLFSLLFLVPNESEADIHKDTKESICPDVAVTRFKIRVSHAGQISRRYSVKSLPCPPAAIHVHTSPKQHACIICNGIPYLYIVPKRENIIPLSLLSSRSLHHFHNLALLMPT
jgi:hypothetical protein